MTDLQEYLCESVFGRKPGGNSISRGIPRWDDPMLKRSQVVKWLKDEGFDELDTDNRVINGQGKIYEKLVNSPYMNQFYIVGRYRGQGTDWVQFGDYEHLFFVRTGEEHYGADAMQELLPKWPRFEKTNITTIEEFNAHIEEFLKTK